MKSRWLRLLAILLALGLLAAACGSDDDDNVATDDGSSDDGSADDDGSGDDGSSDDDGSGDDGSADDDDGSSDDGSADDGGTDGDMAAGCSATVAGTEIVFAPFATGPFDPVTSSGALVNGTELLAVYDALMVFDPETSGYEPHLAESLEPNDDFTVWTLTLRDGIEFDDGTPLDADAVIASLERFYPADGSRIRNTSQAFLNFIDSQVVVDPLTIEFTLNTPWATFPFVLADEPGMIVNVNAEGDDPEAFGSVPPSAAGVGPYIVESNTPGESIVLKARDNYWAGPVCVETFTVNFSAMMAAVGAAAVYEAFENGDVNMGFLRDETTITEAEGNGETLLLAAQDAGAMVVFNMREGRALLDDTLREAVALAIDPAIISDRAYNGDLVTVKAFIGPDSPYASGDVVEMATDTARAAELVTESGFDGTLGMLCADNPTATETALTVEAQLEAVGIDVEVELLGQTDQIGQLAAGEYDMGCWGFNSGPATAVTSYVRNLLSTSPSNRQGIAVPELDTVLLDALNATPGDLPAALATVNNTYVENFYGLPYGVTREGVVIHPDLMGVQRTNATMFLLGGAYWSDAG